MNIYTKQTLGETYMYFNPLFISLLIIIILLLIVIIVFADLVKAAAFHKRSEEKAKKNSSGGLKTLLLLLTLAGFSNAAVAQEEVTTTVSESGYLGLDASVFYLMLSVIAFEIFIAWGLYAIAMDLLGIRERKKQSEKAKQVVKQPTFIEKINASVAIEKEEDIMLDHNYDGIRELDNDLPPWWKYGFYLTIIFAFIYLINYHIAGTGKLQKAEYEEQLTTAKQQMEEYRKKAANLVDENNAAALTDDASLQSGKSIFIDNCAACHGRSGEGGVGPNLTDNYWLHKGGIKDIFRTVKYGWPEKGMKSWQQDLGAKQIHEVASYIKSLQGSKPANPKDPQGDLFNEGNASDSTKTVVTDTVAVLKEK
ncbi:MAG TPA: cbb3-type cytochrome c oxidase N-terminal domain-containing protein [Bacteroidia bacterium]|nr:cbb3-type cytochrome c oxidase N-terminal domain-containing protein [Bacteroidia bacterium]